MDEINKALNLLEKDKINNISIINFIKNNKVLSTDFIGSSVLIRGVSDRSWVYISCKDKDEVLAIKSKLNKDDISFSSIEEWMFPLLIEGKKIVWDLLTEQYYLPNDVPLPDPKYKTIPLTENDAQIVYSNSEYKDYISLEYVKERIQKGVSSGLHINNELVSWAMTQDDGAIGFLHTLDNFRRKGYGECVTLSIIEKLRNASEIPFAYAEISNKRSINLMTKFGFVFIKKIHWFQIKW